MKRFMVLIASLLLGFVTGGRNTLSASPEIPTDGFIDFEAGVDEQPIQSSIPGLQFTTTAGYDWIYGDWNTGSYNGPYPDGDYYSNGNFFAWLGPNQGAGRIDFTQGCATYFQVWVSSLYGLIAEAYFPDGTLAASASVVGNLYTGQMERLRVDAPSGFCFSYVLLHDTGNYWIIDDLSTDAGGVPSTRPPVLIIPGLMGSKLRNDDTCQNEDEEIWPAPLKLIHPYDPHLEHLYLAENGVDEASNCDHIYTDGIVDEVLTVDFYKPLVEYLDETANFDVEIFDYDWRLDLVAAANELDAVVDNLLSNSEATQVNIVSHSLGGLLARYYVTSDPTRADKVEQVISLGTPYLGAPKAFKILRIGDSLLSLNEMGTIGLLYAPRVKVLAQNAPAFYQTLPTERYFDIYGGGYYRLEDTLLSLVQTQSFIYDNHNQNLANAAEAFHSDAMDDWGSIPLDVAYRLIVGSGGENTPGLFHEYTEINWKGDEVTKYDIDNINGDGTVPLHSADLKGNGFDYSGGVPIWYSNNLDHLQLVKTNYVLEFIGAMLSTPPNPTALEQASQTSNTNISPSLALYKGPIDRFPQRPQGDTVPPTPLEMGDQPFAIEGGQIAAFGAVSLHVYDALGNHTGPVEGEDRIDLSIPNSGYITTEDSIFVTVQSGGIYTIEVESESAYDFDLRVRNIQGMDTNLIQRTITYIDVPMSSNGLAQLLSYNPSDPGKAQDLSIDIDGDGDFDQFMPPTGDVGSEDSNDVTNPTIDVALEGEIGANGWYIGDVLVTILASDDESGLAKLDYSTDFGQSVQTYNSPFTVSAEEVSLLIVKATDYVGNEGWVSIQIGPDKIYLPTIINLK